MQVSLNDQKGIIAGFVLDQHCVSLVETSKLVNEDSIEEKK